MNLVIKASDLGEQFTEEALAELFLSYIDAGSLKFRQAEAAFSIAAGTIRVQNLGIETPECQGGRQRGDRPEYADDQFRLERDARSGRREV